MPHFDDPNIHHVARVSSEVVVLGGGDNGRQFACISVTFHGPNNNAVLEIYLEDDRIEYARRLSAAINLVKP